MKLLFVDLVTSVEAVDLCNFFSHHARFESQLQGVSQGRCLDVRGMTWGREIRRIARLCWVRVGYRYKTLALALEWES